MMLKPWLMPSSRPLRILDEKNLPKQGRTAVLSPRQYYALVSQVDSNILNRDYGNSQGNLNSGEGLYEIAGISIKRSNNLPFLAGSCVFR
jgi:SRSO17 transposase